MTSSNDRSSPAPHFNPEPAPGGLLNFWHRTPLYVRILAGIVLGVVTGLVLGPRAADFALPGKLVLRVLGALAPPLILLAIIHALMTAKIEGRTGARMVGLLLLNTLVAILIGLLVANVLRPGQHSHLSPPPATPAKTAGATAAPDTLTQMLDNVPKSVLGPLGDEGKVVGVILLAVAFGLALRSVKNEPIRDIEDAVSLGLRTLITILGWVVEVVPLAVYGIVASIIGTKGLADFKALGAFVVAVLLALLLQSLWYLTRIRFGSWVRPLPLLGATRDALVMAFSTGSSTITMPLTYARLRERVGLRQRSASLGALVGSNFNNDGTALYEAMSALFISQMLGRQLTLGQQLLVVVTSVVASVGAAGIPEAGLVTMTLVFHAVGLPPEYIAILLTVDWFLDRARTAINVMGDMNVSCLLDGETRETPEEAAREAADSGAVLPPEAAPAL
jgi:Na+/H+-dicarboxylate symporter